MRLGNRPEMGAMALEGNWYFGLEWKWCPPDMFRVIKPVLMIWCFKIVEHGDFGIIDGKETVWRGFRWFWKSPRGITIPEIV